MNRTIKLVVGLVFTVLLSQAASAEKLQLPPGMGGVPDIGAIPCDVFNKMIVVGPLGTKRLLLTWAEGYFYAKSGQTIDEIIEAAEQTGQTWDFDSLTGHLAAYCAADPEALTAAAVEDLGEHLLKIP